MKLGDLLRETASQAKEQNKYNKAAQELERDHKIASEYIGNVHKAMTGAAEKGATELVVEVPDFSIGRDYKPTGPLKLVLAWAENNNLKTSVFERRVAPMVEDFFIRFSW